MNLLVTIPDRTRVQMPCIPFEGEALFFTAMKLSLPVRLMLLVLGFATVAPLRADYLANTDLKEGMSAWHGDGESVYLKPDGTEGTEDDTGAVLVFKLRLSPDQPRYIYQEIKTRENPATLHFKVDFLASADFQPSKSESDYTPELLGPPGSGGGSFEWADYGIVEADFWIKAGPSSYRSSYAYDYFMTANAIKGKWVTVDRTFQGVEKIDDRTVYFCAPPGVGTLYLKNPSVTP